MGLLLLSPHPSQFSHQLPTAKWLTQSKNVRKQTLPKVGILIPKPFSKFSKLKNQTQKTEKKTPYSTKKPKNAIRSKKIEKLKKTDPPNVGILIPKQFLKFSKLKNQTQKTKKDPLKYQKNAIRSKKIEKLKKTGPPPKSVHSDSKTIFKI